MGRYKPRLGPFYRPGATTQRIVDRSNCLAISCDGTATQSLLVLVPGFAARWSTSFPRIPPQNIVFTHESSELHGTTRLLYPVRAGRQNHHGSRSGRQGTVGRVDRLSRQERGGTSPYQKRSKDKWSSPTVLDSKIMGGAGSNSTVKLMGKHFSCLLLDPSRPASCGGFTRGRTDHSRIGTSGRSSSTSPPAKLIGHGHHSQIKTQTSWSR